MDAILFSANPNMVQVDDAIRHLAEHEELYWEVGFQIADYNFSYPMYGFIHIKGGRVEYRAIIRDILPFSHNHYEDKALAERIKPEPWLREWRENSGNARSYPWKNALVMTEIVPFSCDTQDFLKIDGTKVKRPPQSFVRVLLPDHTLLPDTPDRPIIIDEETLEKLIAEHPEAIEPGLRLISRQLSTPVGRLDLLCEDADGNYVVVELKRMQGSDQVMGQVLRYMGWLTEQHGMEKVRGVIIVRRRDRALSYAAKAVRNVKVREFVFSIRE